jgi:hypothetical protein
LTLRVIDANPKLKKQVFNHKKDIFMKTMMIGLLALTTLSSSAFASTALYCGKQILTATGTDYPLGAGGTMTFPPAHCLILK